MALFNFRKKDPLTRLKQKEWTTDEERDGLIREVLKPNGTRDITGLVELLFSPDGVLQRSTLRYIGTLQDITVLDTFMKMLHGRSISRIQGLCRALPKVLPADYQSHLNKHLESKDNLVRRASEELLLSGGMNKTIMNMADQWLDPGSEPRRTMQFLDILERGQRKDKTLDISRIAMKAIEHPNEDVRTRGYSMFRGQNSAEHLSIFIEALGQESYNNQEIIGELIAQQLPLSTLPASETIFPLLASGTTALRSTAVKVIKKLPNRGKIIRDFFLYSRALAPWVRDRAFDTLQELEDALLEPMLDMMEDEDKDLRILAISLASMLGEDPRMLKPLLKTLKEDNWWVRSMAAETLARLGDPVAIEPLKKLLEDKDDIWFGIDALARLAQRLHKDKRRREATVALDPLFRLLKTGQGAQRPQSTKEEEDESADLRVETITALRAFNSTAVLDVFQRVASGDRSSKVQAEALAAARSMAEHIGTEIKEEASLRDAINRSIGDNDNLKRLERYLTQARVLGASDLHITVDRRPIMRKTGILTDINEDSPLLDAKMTANLIRELLTEEQAARMRQYGQIDFCYEIAGAGRYRANVFVDHRGVNAVFRIIPQDLPTIKSIGLPGKFEEVRYWHQGLLLVCGSAGSGKSTTLAALINLINETRQSHVLCIEDPIEYVHPCRRSLINQRELTTHTRSYHRALRGALREDPDVIVIGELRDNETVKLALEAAETGHLVIGTLNCTRADTAVDRVVGSFPSDEQAQARQSIADSLKGIIAQTLVPNIEGTDMVAAFEVIVGIPTVANLIRDNKMYMMASLMQTGRSVGMQTFDDALLELVSEGKIQVDVAYKRAKNKEAFEPLLNDAPQTRHHGEQTVQQ